MCDQGTGTSGLRPQRLGVASSIRVVVVCSSARLFGQSHIVTAPIWSSFETPTPTSWPFRSIRQAMLLVTCYMSEIFFSARHGNDRYIHFFWALPSFFANFLNLFSGEGGGGHYCLNGFGTWLDQPLHPLHFSDF